MADFWTLNGWHPRQWVLQVPLSSRKKNKFISHDACQCVYIYGTVILYVPTNFQNREKSRAIPKTVVRQSWYFWRWVPHQVRILLQLFPLGAPMDHLLWTNRWVGCPWWDGYECLWGICLRFFFRVNGLSFWGFESAKKSWVNSCWWMSTNKLIQTWCMEKW